VRAVLCDLDDTLFDHAGATLSALAALRAFEPAFQIWSLEEFDTRHRAVLDTLHADVLTGQRSIAGAREERFRRLLAATAPATPPDHPVRLSAAYRLAYESAWQPVPGALALVAALQQRGVAVAVITNNLIAEQRLKLTRCGLAPFVEALVTSEEVGVAKPGREMFDEAIRRLRVRPSEAVVFGDAWPTDIAGAHAAGLRAVWFNRGRAPRPDPSVAEIRSLVPLDDVLKALAGC
jgi:putative hydrolase of the HAD superfamily